MTEAEIEAYERGRFIEYQRAISRTEIGLPVERGLKPWTVEPDDEE